MSLLKAFFRIALAFVLIFAFLFVSAVIFTYTPPIVAVILFLLCGLLAAWIITLLLSGFAKGEE